METCGMKYAKGTLAIIVLMLTTGANMNAFGFLGVGNSPSWKEEVLLHDGRTIIVERSQELGGYPTVESRERTTLEEEWVLPVPGTEWKISWKTGFKTPPEGPSLMLVLVGFPGGTPYIATVAAGCIAYNHWGRPNPPYVFFKYDGANWQRIPLEEFPTELKEANVVVGRPDSWHRSGLLSIATIKEENHRLEPYMRQIVRAPVKVAQTTDCAEMVHDGNGGWTGIGCSGQVKTDTKSSNL
jgi:hypothetical protein